MSINKKIEMEAYRQVEGIVETLKKERDSLIEMGRQRFCEAIKRRDHVSAHNAQELAGEFKSLVDRSYCAFRSLIIETYGSSEGDKIAPQSPEPFFVTWFMVESGSLGVRGELNAMSSYLVSMRNKYLDYLETPDSSSVRKRKKK